MEPQVAALASFHYIDASLCRVLSVCFKHVTMRVGVWKVLCVHLSARRVTERSRAVHVGSHEASSTTD